MTKPKPTKYVFVEVSAVEGELIRDTVEYKLPIDRLEEIKSYFNLYLPFVDEFPGHKLFK